MVLFFCVTLAISVVGLVTILWVKRWEMQTGNVVLASVRPQVAHLSHSMLTWVERVLPHLAAVYARRTARAAEDMLHHGAARGLLAAEHGLERVLQSLRGVTEQPRSNKEASVFLREVAEHKRKLLHRKKKEVVKVQPEE